MGKGCSWKEVKNWCSKELRLKSLGLVHHNYHLFVESQWSEGYVAPWFLTYRICVAFLLITWATLDLFTEADSWYLSQYYMWFLFATNWSFLFLAFSSLVSAFNTIRYYAEQRKKVLQADIPPPPTAVDCFLSFQWLLHSLSTNCTIVVSVSFWAFIVADGSPFLHSNLSKLKHTLTSIYAIVDLFVIATPVRLLHVVYPLLGGIVYVMFNAIYFQSGGAGPYGKNYAYEVLEWKKNTPTSIVTSILALVMVVLSQVVVYLIYKLRLSLFQWLKNSDDGDLLAEQFLTDVDEDGGVQESDLSTPKVPENYHAIN